MGRAATLFYLAVYTLMTLGVFGVVYHVAGEGNRRSTLDDYAGLGWERPALGFAMLVFLLSLAGFPPTGGFVAKLYLLRASMDAGLVTLAVILVLTTVVSYFYYLRVVWKMYFEEAPEGLLASPAGPGRGFRWAAAACVVGILAAGLLPGRGIDAAREATDSLVDAPPPAAEAAPPPATSDEELTGISRALAPRSGGRR
jgi:NADH-quinone oxidoreductase subunit N